MGKVESEGGGRALGVGEGVEDGEAHVGDGDLGEDGAVYKLHQGMDRALRVDGDADAVGGEREEAAGFDDLEAFVHHGGGVDRDAAAHLPGRVFEGLVGRDAGEVFGGGVAEGASGGGEPDLLHFLRSSSAHGLVDGVVLGVDGEEGDVSLSGGGDDEVSGGYEALLVGEADGLSGEDGGVGGFETGNADDGGDYEVNFGMGGYGYCPGGAVKDFDAGDAFGAEAKAEGFGEELGGEGDQAGAPLLGLGKGGLEVGSGGQGDGEVAVRELLADGEGALADGAGGAEDGDLLHGFLFVERGGSET